MEKPDKCCKHDAAFKVEALRVASESCLAQAAAYALNLNPKLLYRWQQEAQPVRPLGPAEMVEVRQLCAANKRLAQELGILKKAIAIFSTLPTSWTASS